MSAPTMTVGKRQIKDGSRYNGFFPAEGKAYGNYSVLKQNGDVYQTVKFIAQIIKKDKADTAKIARELKRSSRIETLKSIHHFMVNYLQYDVETGEKLRSPRRTWWVGSRQYDKQTGNTGVDCDDLVIFSGTILRNLNIPFFIRIVKINTDEFQHVYLIVPKSGNDLSNGYITLDGVISEFNYEYPYKLQNTFDMNGLKIEYLGNIGNVATPVSTFDEIFNMLSQQYNELISGDMVPTKINRTDLIRMLGYALKNWHVNRNEALKNLADAESKSYPGQSFFRKISDLVNRPASLRGDWLPSDWTEEDQALLDSNKEVSNYHAKKGSFWTALSSAFDAAAKFDWGLVRGKNNPANQQPQLVQPYNYSKPKSGVDLGSIWNKLGIYLVGGVLVFGTYKLFVKHEPIVSVKDKRLKK
jgi:hypothetical protein